MRPKASGCKLRLKITALEPCWPLLILVFFSAYFFSETAAGSGHGHHTSAFQQSTDRPFEDKVADGYARAISNIYDARKTYRELKIRNPLNNSLFPADIAAPNFEWVEKEDDIDSWLITVSFSDRPPIHIACTAPQWTPTRELWETIKQNSLNGYAQSTILGVKNNSMPEIISKGSVRISTSSDAVHAPILFRRVPPSFSYASLHPELMEWCLGDISSYDAPPVVMSNQPVCASCHTFSRDGGYMGMDVDYNHDKGGYFLGRVRDIMVITGRDIFSWNEFPRNDGLQGSGLFSRLSPDGNYVASTVNDISFLAEISDPYCSELFFPIQSNLAYYSKEKGTISLLVTGSDRHEIVDTDPSWSAEGDVVLFARATMMRDLFRELGGETVFSAANTNVSQLNKKYPVQFSVYRVHFSKGKGGRAEALPGASNNGKSNYFARCSPDGRWIVFTQSDSGIALQPDSRLLILPSSGGTPRLLNCNRKTLNSWHTWAPNSRWLAFVSKENMPYTELYLTHIDQNGRDSVPILISRFNKPGYSVNVPEFANIPVDGIRELSMRPEADFSQR